MNNRMLVWFSCGAASAVAAKLTLFKYPSAEIVCCDTRVNEHQDNYRFSVDCEKWFGKPIIFIKSEKYSTIDEVFEQTRYMSGVGGARCTTELKKRPRQNYETPYDVHVFGYTSDEKTRIKDFENRNPELNLYWPLQELSVNKKACYLIVKAAGIDLPKMYKYGFKNNNCMGCVKASSPRYWALVREVDPETFERRCRQSRELGVKLVEIKHHVRIFLDELPLGDFGGMPVDENVSCGPECAA